MAFEFKLPDIGEGLTEGEVVKWLVKEGDLVENDQPMVEVMTDKATVEITAPRAGRIQKIVAAEGKTIPVGSVMVVIDVGAGGDEKAGPASSPPQAEKRDAEAEAPFAAAAEPAAEPSPAPEREAASRAKAPPRGEAAVRRPPAARRTQTLAAPATRRLARELGVDLDEVPATGPNGRVTREDVERYAKEGASPEPAPSRAPAAREGAAPEAAALPPRPPAPTVGAPREDEHVPLRGLRGKIAEQMVRAKQAPHFTYVDECDMTEVVALREKARPLAEARGVKLTFLPFVIKALAAAIRRHPVVNAIVDDEAGGYVMKRDVHVGLATDTDAGLMVPVVKHADRRSLLDLAAEIQNLTTLARTRKIEREDLKGSTITITSAGSLGGILATPILNYPEVAILGVYRVKDRPVVRDGQIVVRKMTNLSITLDHRIVDGATAARFLNDLIRLLETPGLLLMEGA